MAQTVSKCCVFPIKAGTRRHLRTFAPFPALKIGWLRLKLGCPALMTLRSGLTCLNTVSSATVDGTVALDTDGTEYLKPGSLIIPPQ